MGRQECPPHPHSGFPTVRRRCDRNTSLMAIANHVILSGAKNLPSSRLDVQRKPSPARMRGGMVSLAPPQHDSKAGRQECPPHPHSGFFSVTVGRRHHRYTSLMAITNHVILSGAKNLPSSGLDVQRKPSPTRMRGGMVSLAPPQDDSVGEDVPHAGSRRMTEHAQTSSDAAVDPSSACLPMNRRQSRRLPLDDRFGEGPACYSERNPRLPTNAWSLSLSKCPHSGRP